MRIILILALLLTMHIVPQDDKFSELREAMVEKQIISRGVTEERVIEAMRTIPRHLFVPDNMVEVAYADSPLPIGFNQTISQPYIVALMTELAIPSKKKNALEIGTGSGYQAAVLSMVVDTVYTIEIVTELAKQSSELFKKLGYTNIISKSGDGYAGWPEHAPFDIIIVTAAPEKIPPPLIEQLAEGGRMVIPVGKDYNQELLLLIKRNGRIVERKILPVRFVPFQRL